MKKTFAVIAAVLFVLSFAASAFAIHAEIPAETQAIVAKGSTQLTLGGEIRIRGWYYDNLGANFGAAVGKNPQDSNSKANWDQRVRLSVDAVVSPNVMGKLLLETGGSDGSTTDIYSLGRLNQKPNGVTTFSEAWILYTGSGLFGFNSGLKIGHMPLKLSEGVFFDNTQYGDDAVVFFMDPSKELHIGLLTIKASEAGVAGSTTGNNQNTNDLDAYVGLMTYKLAPTHTIGLNYTYINESDADLKFQNLGLHANGKAGNFGYKAEVDFQFGSVFSGASKSKFSGLGVMLGGNYSMNALNLRGMFAYGSGNKTDTTKNEAFQTLVGGIQHYTFVYDYRAATAANGQTLSGINNGAGTGIANTTVYDLGLDYKATKEIGTKFDVYFLRANKVASNVSKNIGTELDATVTYQVAKNLTYAVNIGHLITGNFYHEAFGVQKKNTTVLNNVLTLSF
ncbi:MAG: alginate export family protein [Nitrospirae bacterium]|nr:alginate export family protein [Nitrospirota bacterium]